jgi:hypothetical protein
MRIYARQARAIAVGIVVLPLTAIIGLSYLLSPRRFDGIERTIATYLSTRSIDLSYAEGIERESAIYVQGTQYEGRINARQPPIPDHLNIYVLGSDPLRRFRAVRCNCAYIGHRIVICDKRFLDTFAASLRYSQTDSIPVLKRVNEALSHVLFSWILGHEIGHAVLHDADGRFTISAKWGQHWIGNDTTSLWQAREQEADEFVANHLTPTEIRLASFTLMNMVFQVYHRAYLDQHSGEDKTKQNWPKPIEAIRHFFQTPRPSSSNVVTIQPVDGIHDPWVFRALRMASVLEKREVPAAAAKSSYLPELSADFVVAKGGFDPGGFCDGLPLRKD